MSTDGSNHEALPAVSAGESSIPMRQATTAAQMLVMPPRAEAVPAYVVMPKAAARGLTVLLIAVLVTCVALLSGLFYLLGQRSPERGGFVPQSAAFPPPAVVHQVTYEIIQGSSVSRDAVRPPRNSGSSEVTLPPPTRVERPSTLYRAQPRTSDSFLQEQE
jgi:hypothetical protein